MANKKVQIGALLVNEIENDGRKRKLISIGLGNKGKNDAYNNTVEVIVKDSTGKIIHKQTDGYLELVDPRTEANDLLEAGLISEEMAEKMNERVANIPDKVRYKVRVNVKS